MLFNLIHDQEKGLDIDCRNFGGLLVHNSLPLRPVVATGENVRM